MNSPSAGSRSSAGWRCDLRFIFITLLFLTLISSLSLAQEATIVGTVTDSTGAAVPGASITVTNTDTGLSRALTTEGDGQYVIPNLHIGHYVVLVNASGFKMEERKDLLLQVGDRTRIDFALQVGNTRETITVEANPVAVQTDSGEVSNVVTSKQVSDLPTNGRTLYNLYALTPGAVSLQGTTSARPRSAATTTSASTVSAWDTTCC